MIAKQIGEAPRTRKVAKADNGRYVRSYYDVPAYVGTRILFEGQPYVITGFDRQYLLVEINGQVELLHPTWHVEYPTIAEEVGD